MSRAWIGCYLILLMGCEKMSVKQFNTQNRRSLASSEAFLFVFNGESNSGGFAVNADLSGGELPARTAIKIRNNTSGDFENIDIGTNNLIGHTGLTDNGTHGWEAGLANEVEAGVVSAPVYLVKTGQGGSIITEWNVGGSYWNTMTARIDDAISDLTGLGKTPVIVVWWTLGINDRIAGTNEATWRTNVETFIAAFREEYGSNVKFHVPLFMDNDNANFNDTLLAIDAADSNFFTVSSDSAGLRDDNHWNAAGMKILANRLLYSTINNL
jgi:hypothetical protein